EVDGIEAEPERGPEPAEGREDGSGRDPDPVLLDVGSEVIHERNAGGDEDERHGPLKDFPQPDERFAQAEPPGNPVTKFRSEYDHGERRDSEQRQSDTQKYGQQAYAPPGPVLDHAVGPVHHVSDPGERRRRAPQGEEEADANHTRVATLRHEVANDLEPGGRHEWSERADGGVDEVLEEEQPRDGDQ